MMESIGPYTLTEQLGEGGMGVVYQAKQESPVKRTVAIKILKAGLETGPLLARFEAERQALAMMDHPGIARIFDAGETPTGQPYFVMELVSGSPIDSFCNKNDLNLRQRLQLFVIVCEAVQHAHQKGIIHRDLKPSNLLVDGTADAPSPKIIDFGIAKALQGPGALTDKTMVTRFNQVLGTPAYMSPEQLDISGYSVDTRADIYALGAVLYELLTGDLPFDRERLESASAADLERILIEEEPPKPSRHRKELAGDLDWIIMKALDKDHNKRYANVDAFAADLTAFLEDAPVSARPPSPVYLMRKFARRHRIGIAFGATVLALLIAGIVVSTQQAIRAKRAEAAEAAKSRLATQRLAESDAMLDFVTIDMMGQALPVSQPDRDIKLITAVDMASDRVNEKFGQQPRIRCFMHLRMAIIYNSALSNFDKADEHTSQAAAALKVLRAQTDPTVEPAMQELDEMETDITRQMGTNAVGRSDLQAGLAHLTKAWELSKKCRGPGAQSTLSVRLEMSRCLVMMGPDRYEESAAILFEVEEGFRRLDDPLADWEWINLLHSLGTAYRNVGQPERAVECLREIEALYGAAQEQVSDPTGKIKALYALGIGYFNNGEPERSVPFLEEAVERGKKLYGARHERQILALNALGGVYTNLQRHEDAYPLLKVVWETQHEFGGPEKEWTLIYLRNLTYCTLQCGRFEEAEGYLDQLLENTYAHMGSGHYLTRWATETYQTYWKDDPAKMAALHTKLSGEEPWPKDRLKVLVAKGSPWRYQTGRAPGEAWTEDKFDDNSWEEGAAPLGYGESDVVTEIPAGPDPDAKWAAAFFRYRFESNPDQPLEKLRLKIRRDDGAAVYLNGKPVFRDRLPEASETTWETYATGEVTGLEEKLYHTVEIDPALLEKDNTLAVQVHQCNAGSSDVMFDLQLEGIPK